MDCPDCRRECSDRRRQLKGACSECLRPLSAQAKAADRARPVAFADHGQSCPIRA